MTEQIKGINNIKGLLLNALLLLMATVLVVTMCYYFVDRPVAIWAVTHDWAQLTLVSYLTKLPTIFFLSAPIAVLWGVIIRGWRQWYFGEQLAFAIGCGVVVALALKNNLKLLFGRTWPATWHHHNPSLLHDGVYGFYPFNWSNSFHSFPSGHAMVTALVFVTLASVYPRFKPYCWGVIGLVALALVLKNYHFVGDVIAGGSLGIIGSWLTLSWFGLIRSH